VSDHVPKMSSGVQCSCGGLHRLDWDGWFDPTGLLDSTKAIQAKIDAGGDFPAGTYSVVRSRGGAPPTDTTEPTDG
jgi:hypothetical protein